MSKSDLSRSEITALLDGWSAGNAEAFDQLIPLVIGDLRRIAANFLVGEAADHTLQPTALVNELYLHFAGRKSVQWTNRGQFFAVASKLMRRILVDHARRKRAARHGGGVARVVYEDTVLLPQLDQVDLIALDLSLERLAAIDPRQCRIVELRFFSGLTLKEVAEVLGVSTMTVKREWRTAKLWLSNAMGSSASSVLQP